MSRMLLKRCGLVAGAVLVVLAGAVPAGAGAPAAIAAPHQGALAGPGVVVGWGGNFAGQIGDGTVTGRVSPVETTGLPDAVRVSGGPFHTLAIRADGSVWAWGNNGSGQLGDGTTIDRRAPVKVPLTGRFVDVAAGALHSLAVRDDGSIWAWGENQDAQIGDGTFVDRHSPVHLAATGSTNKFVQVAADDGHNLALRDNGDVWSWGRNLQGRIGPVNVGGGLNAPTPIPGMTSVAQIDTGRFHSAVLRTDGTVFVFGDNDSGQLGNGTAADSPTPTPVQNLVNVTRIAVGTFHTVVLRANGTLVAWGSREHGELGDGIGEPGRSPRPVPGISGVSQIAAGGQHTLAVVDGQVFSWGLNQFGQLGDGSTVDNAAPTLAPGLSDAVAVAAGGFTSFATVPDLALTATPLPATVVAGTSATSTLTVPGTGTLRASLSVSGLPSDVSASISPAIVNRGGQATLTITTETQALNGTSQLTVRATSGVLVRTVPLQLTIIDGLAPDACSPVNTTDVPILDNGPAAPSPIFVVDCDTGLPLATGPGGHPPTTAGVGVHILHPRRGDLVIDLIAPGGTVHRLKDSDPTDTGSDVHDEFVVNLKGGLVAPHGAPSGLAPDGDRWTLRVQDVIQGGTGQTGDANGLLDGWSLSLE